MSDKERLEILLVGKYTGQYVYDGSTATMSNFPKWPSPILWPTKTRPSSDNQPRFILSF